MTSRIELLADPPVGGTEPDTSVVDRQASGGSVLLRRIAMVVLGLSVAVVTIQIATFDLRERPLVGDEASHVLQTLSVAYSGNLSYEMSDLDHFAEMEWRGATRPNGIFYQRYEHGWAFAKPYGFSVVAAPLVRLFGPVPGLAMTNAILFLVIVACAFAIGRRAGWYGAVFGVASVVASMTWLYGFSAHSELFLVALISALSVALVEYRFTDRVAWLVGAAALTGIAVAEKPPFLFGLAPVLILLTWRGGARRIAIGAVACIAAFLLAIVPYLFYSDFSSWNPYAGERYYRADGILPFAPEAPPLSEYRTMTHRGENFSPGVLFDRMTHDPGRGAQAVLYEFVGRYTGMLVFLPMTLAALLLALGRLRGPRGSETATVVGGVLLYLVLYALIFPNNYFGGEQSLGNRYLLQLSPLALAGVAFARPSNRATIAATTAGLLLAVGFLWPHFQRPTTAYVELGRTSALQRALPEEQGIVGIRLFRCGIPAVMWGPFEAYDDRVERIETEKECLRHIPPR